MRRILLLFWIGVLVACSTTSSMNAQNIQLHKGKWVILPLINHTDTPQAGLAAEAIVEHLLLRRGITELTRYPATLNKDTLFDPAGRKVQEEAMTWAKQQGARYALSGAVHEWRYKVGIDGEPAVGVTLQLIDLTTGEIVWSAAGAKSGWSREALAHVGQELLAKLVASLPALAPAN